MISITGGWSEAPLYQLDIVDSSNNYASSLMAKSPLPNGTIVLTQSQTKGRGQRGNSWMDEAGASLLMSLVYAPISSAHLNPFLLNATVGIAVVTYLLEILPNAEIGIKWPNDIFIGDKKTAGILIENSFRAQEWQHAIIGIGINVHQQSFPATLSQATSLYRSTGVTDYPEFTQMARDIRLHFFHWIEEEQSIIWNRYHQLLYKLNNLQCFLIDNKKVSAIIKGVREDGQLLLQIKDELHSFYHGSLQWLYED